MIYSTLSCSVLRSVFLLIFLLLITCCAEVLAQQEGNYLFLGGPIRIKPTGLSSTLFFPYNPVYYNDTIDEIEPHFGGFHVDCDTVGIDLQYSTILTRGLFSPITSQFPGVYLDTSGIGNTMAFPDRADPNILHALMPSKQTYPDYAVVQNISLVTYDRLTFNVLRNTPLADSIAFGLHQVIRHQNRRDYWLVAMRSLQNNWYQPLVWLVRGMQISGPINQAPVYIHANGNPIFQRMLQSPDENTLVVNTAKGAFTLFKFDRSTGQLYGRLPVDLQRIFYRPYAGDLLITTMNFSPYGTKLYAFTTDYRSFPFRNRFYQFDLTVWDSLAVTRRFYSYITQDTVYHDFIPASNNRVYFMQFEPFSNFASLGHILEPDANWGIAGHELITIATNLQRPEAIGTNKFNVSRAHYNHPERYRFSATTGCIGDPIQFRMNEIRNMTHVVWDMGDGQTYVGDSLYDPIHTYTSAGHYLVKATAQFCGQTVIMEDSVLVPGPPTATLMDTIVCDASTISLSAFQPLALSEHYLWSDGDTNEVRSISQQGWWWVEVQGSCGSFRDSFYVSYSPKPATGLPTDTVFCTGSVGELVIQGGNYKWYWPDSSTQLNYIPLPTENEVSLRLQNHCGDFTHTVQINRVEAPIYAEIDTVYCQSLPYIADFNWDNYTRISWDDGDTSRVRRITKAYNGAVDVAHPCGDQRIAVQIARERCDCNLLLPTAFSPNGDGLNDSYAPVYDCQPKFFEMVVFDRWGKIIFQTTNPNQAWDGTFQGQLVESGFYAVKVAVVGVASSELRNEGTSVFLSR